MIPKLIMFDLDGTLAESKQPIKAEMAALLAKLLDKTAVSVVSGGALAQFLKQVVSMLPSDANLSHLYLLPTSGGALYEFRNDNWKKIYEERLSEKDKDTIETAMQAASEETGLIDFSEPAYGERIEYRGSQVTMSALGQHAPLGQKLLWDPTREKRRILQANLAARLPEFSVGMGGITSVDVTKRGIDKAYGVHQLCERLGIKERDALYVGDELGPGGNDEAVYKTEVKTKAVTNPTETARLIKALLS